jgi:hypothetical protein
MNNKISILDIAVFMIALIILSIWVGIEKLIERRELKELERELKRRII